MFFNKLYFLTSAYKIMYMPGVDSSQALVQTRRRFKSGVSSDGFYVMISDPYYFYFENCIFVYNDKIEWKI